VNTFVSRQITTPLARDVAKTPVSLYIEYFAFISSLHSYYHSSLKQNTEYTSNFQNLEVTARTARLNIEKYYFILTECAYMFCTDLRTNSDYFPMQHILIGSYNGDDVCLLRGTD